MKGVQIGWVLANMSEDAMKEYEAITGKQITQRFSVSDKEFADFSKQMRELAKEQSKDNGGNTGRN